jgi:hypothetical protein
VFTPEALCNTESATSINRASIGDELPFPATLGSFARLLEGLKPVAIEGWEVKERKNFVPSRVIPHSPGKNSRAS